MTLAWRKDVMKDESGVWGFPVEGRATGLLSARGQD